MPSRAWSSTTFRSGSSRFTDTPVSVVMATGWLLLLLLLLMLLLIMMVVLMMMMMLLSGAAVIAVMRAGRAIGVDGNKRTWGRRSKTGNGWGRGLASAIHESDI